MSQRVGNQLLILGLIDNGDLWPRWAGLVSYTGATASVEGTRTAHSRQINRFLWLCFQEFKPRRTSLDGIVTIVTFTESFENVSPIMSAPIGSVLLRKNDWKKHFWHSCFCSLLFWCVNEVAGCHNNRWPVSLSWSCLFSGSWTIRAVLIMRIKTVFGFLFFICWRFIYFIFGLVGVQFCWRRS